jgi:hypothetical protein
VSVPGALADFGPDFREASCCPRSSNNRAGSVRLSIWCSPGNTSQDTTADGDWKALDLLIEPANYPFRFYPTDFPQSRSLPEGPTSAKSRPAPRLT